MGICLFVIYRHWHWGGEMFAFQDCNGKGSLDIRDAETFASSVLFGIFIYLFIRDVTIPGIYIEL